ncbi:MAG: nicotinate (nicotinamide) nucleotide adenylyltransferase, partial [Polaromonas sp.]
MSRRIGVFGGAFDPPHNAHVALARAALEQFALDALYIVPTGQAWHKARTLSDAEDRLAMTRLAFGDIAGVVVDERELQRAGPTFTIDTLQALQAENPAAQLYLFIGADQFSTFRQWHKWQEILELAIICIADRAQSTLAQ